MLDVYSELKYTEYTPKFSRSSVILSWLKCLSYSVADQQADMTEEQQVQREGDAQFGRLKMDLP